MSEEKDAKVELNDAGYQTQPVRRVAPGGTGWPPTYSDTTRSTVLPIPQYREHLEDLLVQRQALDIMQLVQNLIRTDPDFSSAMNAYLTVADRPMQYRVFNPAGDPDPEGQRFVRGVIMGITQQYDFKGYKPKPSLRTINDRLRFITLMRGAAAAELVFNKQQLPSELRIIDPRTIRFEERELGELKPLQEVGGIKIPLDIPSFFWAPFHQDPTSAYPYSPFSAAVNSTGAKTQVINDLYRIMRTVGFPRLDAKLLEETIRNSLPEAVVNDPNEAKKAINAEIQSLITSLSAIRSSDALVHTDSVELRVINDKNPGAGMQVQPIFDALVSESVAGLKTMKSVIGRGEAGINTGTVEARLFSLNADAVNKPLAEIWSKALRLAALVQGKDLIVEVFFPAAELRPDTELEAQKALLHSRLLKDLSLGIITMGHYYEMMYGTLPPPNIPDISGTGFEEKGSLQPTGQSPTGGENREGQRRDSLGRSAVPEGSDSARSNATR